MTTLIKHKRVEFSELFYDLVFVFAISKATTLIDHLHNGILTWNSFFDFFMAVLVLTDSWMIQTVYTNRYGKNSLFNMVIMFIKMGLLLPSRPTDAPANIARKVSGILRRVSRKRIRRVLLAP